MTLAIGFALAASLSWGIGDFLTGVKVRSVGVLGFLIPAQLIGLLPAVLFVAARAAAWPGNRVLLAIPAAAGSSLGLLAFLRALKSGSMNIVAPIAGTSAVVPVLFGVAAGDSLSPRESAGIATALAGVVLAAREPGSGDRSRLAAGAGFAVLASVLFGFYFPAMHAAGNTDPYWALLVFRLTSSAFMCAVFLVIRPQLAGRHDLPVVFVAGLLDVGGNLLYALSASAHGLVGIVSVVSATYPAVTVGLASLLLRERATRLQWIGAALAFAGVGLISAV